MLLEQWTACAGDWKKSSLYMTLTSSSALRLRGRRVWLTRDMLAKKYGSYEIADEIIRAKESDEKTAATQIKPHPDAPNNKVQCWGNVAVQYVLYFS